MSDMTNPASLKEKKTKHFLKWKCFVATPPPPKNMSDQAICPPLHYHYPFSHHFTTCCTTSTSATLTRLQMMWHEKSLDYLYGQAWRSVWCWWYACVYSIGLGMYDSPLFLSTHEDSPGGRSVPTTPHQVASPGMCASNTNTCMQTCLRTHSQRDTLFSPVQEDIPEAMMSSNCNPVSKKSQCCVNL